MSYGRSWWIPSECSRARYTPPRPGLSPCPSGPLHRSSHYSYFTPSGFVGIILLIPPTRPFMYPINIDLTHRHAEERSDEVSGGGRRSVSGMGHHHPRPFAALRVTDVKLFMTNYLVVFAPISSPTCRGRRGNPLRPPRFRRGQQGHSIFGPVRRKSPALECGFRVRHSHGTAPNSRRVHSRLPVQVSVATHSR